MHTVPCFNTILHQLRTLNCMGKMCIYRSVFQVSSITSWSRRRCLNWLPATLRDRGAVWRWCWPCVGGGLSQVLQCRNTAPLPPGRGTPLSCGTQCWGAPPRAGSRCRGGIRMRKRCNEDSTRLSCARARSHLLTPGNMIKSQVNKSSIIKRNTGPHADNNSVTRLYHNPVCQITSEQKHLNLYKLFYLLGSPLALVFCLY